MEKDGEGFWPPHQVKFLYFIRKIGCDGEDGENGISGWSSPSSPSGFSIWGDMALRELKEVGDR